MVPIDEKRRWILARLLDIPPMLFGLTVTTTPPFKALPALLQQNKIDVKEYRAMLERYCMSWGSGKIYEAFQDIYRRITYLTGEVLYTSSLEKTQFIQLLCEYHILAATIAHDLQSFDAVLTSLNKAVVLAKENKLYDICSYALRQRGGAYLEKGEIAAHEGSVETAQKDFEAAVRDLNTARTYEDKIAPQRKGLILLVAGHAYAHVARDDKEIHGALDVIDLAGNEIKKSIDDPRIPSRLDEERYHLDKGAAYVASLFEKARFPQQARREFEQATRLTQPIFKTRHAYNAIHQAKAYLVEKQYAMAVGYAEQALDIVKEIDSNKSLALLEGIYKELRRSKFGKDAAVAQLGIELLKVQQPQLFS